MVDIHLPPGNSGSPVYRPDGGVIAVVDKRDSLVPRILSPSRFTTPSNSPNAMGCDGTA